MRIPFDWVPGDPYKIELFTASGLSFEKEIPVAVETPRPSARMFLVFSAMGLYVGILPVAFGILWLPFLRQLGKRWINFFLSFTVGLLVFLGVDALHEGFEVAGKLPGVFSGVGLLAIGFLLAFLFITGIDQFLRTRPGAQGPDASLILAYMIAFGIGIHNLGEGLAIGSAYASGEIALGALLLLGFTIHNTTEGLAIVSPLTRSKVSARSSCPAGYHRRRAGDSRLLDGRLFLLGHRVGILSRDRRGRGIPGRLVDRRSDDENG